MADDGASGAEGPFVGSRCVAGPGGYWAVGTIRRVNEDGTFQFEPAAKTTFVLTRWDGVPPGEVSFDDVGQWAGVFAKISRDGKAFGLADFPGALTLAGHDKMTAERCRELWVEGCAKVFEVAGEEAESHVLDEGSAYRLFLRFGISAKMLADALRPDRPVKLFRMYWNQMRMGGRDPAELPRRVTLDDAFAALGLDASRVGKAATRLFGKLERRDGVRLPDTLGRLLRCRGVWRAVGDCHPNSPYLPLFHLGEWQIRRGMRAKQVDGDFGMLLLHPHQGSFDWWAIFDKGEDDARIYLRFTGDEEGVEEEWVLVAPGVALFFWDLAQTGLPWYREHKFPEEKAVRRSDIGLVPVT